MTYFQEIQQQLENGQVIMNDSNVNFTWTTFTRGGLFQVHIYEGDNFEIKEYKSIVTLSQKVGSLLNRGY
tara:strand:- start:242 stop:451 length:210 start_codon:yes stop_codon:yes gene_type:complete